MFLLYATGGYLPVVFEHHHVLVDSGCRSSLVIHLFLFKQPLVQICQILYIVFVIFI